MTYCDIPGHLFLFYCVTGRIFHLSIEEELPDYRSHAFYFPNDISACNDLCLVF